MLWSGQPPDDWSGRVVNAGERKRKSKSDDSSHHNVNGKSSAGGGGGVKKVKKRRRKERYKRDEGETDDDYEPVDVAVKLEPQDGYYDEDFFSGGADGGGAVGVAAGHVSDDDEDDDEPGWNLKQQRNVKGEAGGWVNQAFPNLPLNFIPGGGALPHPGELATKLY